MMRSTWIDTTGAGNTVEITVLILVDDDLEDVLANLPGVVEVAGQVLRRSEKARRGDTCWASWMISLLTKMVFLPETMECLTMMTYFLLSMRRPHLTIFLVLATFLPTFLPTTPLGRKMTALRAGTLHTLCKHPLRPWFSEFDNRHNRIELRYWYCFHLFVGWANVERRNYDNQVTRPPLYMWNSIVLNRDNIEKMTLKKCRNFSEVGSNSEICLITL